MKLVTKSSLGSDYGKDVVRLLQGEKFPEMDRNNTDTIVRKHWYVEYRTIKGLKFEVMRLDCRIESSMAKAIQTDDYHTTHQQCKELVKFRILDETPRGER